MWDLPLAPFLRGLLNMKASFRLATRGRPQRLSVLVAGLLLAGLCAACGYRYYAGPLQPLPDAQQHTGMQVSDDGTVLFVQERFEVGVRPQTDAELNRLYPMYSKDGMESINPYTYGDWKDPETGSTPQRFTVFLLKVKNYSYPKVQIDPLKVSLIAANGREYPALDPLEFDEYYRPYATAYSGICTTATKSAKTCSPLLDMHPNPYSAVRKPRDS